MTSSRLFFERKCTGFTRRQAPLHLVSPDDRVRLNTLGALKAIFLPQHFGSYRNNENNKHRLASQQSGQRGQGHKNHYSRLLQEGFVFRYPAWDQAALDLCTQWRAYNDHRFAQLV